MRKVKCNKRKGACFLQQPNASHILVGRGGLVPIGTDFVIPISSLGYGRGRGGIVRKELKGGGRRRKKTGKSKKRVSSKKSFARSALLGSGKRRKRRKN